MRNVVVGALLVLAVVVSPALADPTIAVGDVKLLPGTSGQEVEFFVIGEPEDLIYGLNLYVQVADGGPEAVEFNLASDPGISGPSITGIDVVTGTIFEADNDGQFGTTALPQLRDATIATVNDTVVANGLLATVTFDTTEWGPEYVGTSWDLKLTDLGSGSIAFGTTLSGPGLEEWAGVVPTNVINGTMTIVVPEPSTVILLALAGLSLLVWRLRRR